MNLYTEVEFDVEAAVGAALSNRTEKDKKDFERLQEEGRKQLEATDANSVMGDRAIVIATNALMFLSPTEDAEQVAFEMTRMAEGYALKGDFQKAIELTRDETKREEYLQILSAIGAPDCPCPLTTKHGSDTVNTRFPKLTFPGGTLYQCSRCNHLRVI